jgi:hypothetical protein
VLVYSVSEMTVMHAHAHHKHVVDARVLNHGEREGQQRAVADGEQRLWRGGAIERIQPRAGVAGQDDCLWRWPPHDCWGAGCGRRLPLPLQLL